MRSTVHKESMLAFGDVHRRSVVLSDEQYEVLRASALLKGRRTGKLLRDLVDWSLEALGEDSDVQKLVKIARLERSGLKAV